MSGKLRWKRQAAETGLRAVGARPRGYDYHNGTDEFATIYPNGGGWQRPQNGWYWVAFGDGIPHKNTCNDPPYESVEQAKKEASEYVKAHLRKDQP